MPTKRSKARAISERDLDGLVLAAVESLPAGMLIYGEDGEVNFLNGRGREIFSYGSTSVSGLRVDELLGGVPHQWHRGRRKKASVRAELVLVPPDSPKLHLGFETRPVGAAPGAGLRHHVVLFQDVTHLERLREERDQDMLVRSVARLLPTIAHEVKNPLASIQSVVEVLLSDLRDPQCQRDLESILNEVTRLRLLIDRMGLVDQRLCTGADEVDLVPTIQRSLHLARHRAEHLGVELDYTGAAQVRASIHPDLLLSILHNLLNNSLDACRSGDIITIYMARVRDKFELTVRDSGEGMTTETLRHAADLFFTTKGSGSGIGLALIREMVERSGGTLKILSEQGEGTEVTIVTPGVPS
jgi:two-component system sensor histidine kinase HydH